MKISDSINLHDLPSVRSRALWLLDQTTARLSPVQIAKQLTENHEISTTYQAVQNAFLKPDGTIHRDKDGFKLMEKGRRELAGHKGVASVTAGKNFDRRPLHSEVVEKCSALFSKREYAEAVEKSFKVVRDRLRAMTSHETGSEAFGKGRLHLRGAAAPNVDGDFNKGAQFLLMAIDMFRNEKSHTSNAKISDPMHAYQYLVLSSLALRLLDNADAPIR